MIVVHFSRGDEELYEQTKNKQDRYDRKSKMITMAQSNANGVSVTVSFRSCFSNIFFSSFSLGKIKGHKQTRQNFDHRCLTRLTKGSHLELFPQFACG